MSVSCTAARHRRTVGRRQAHTDSLGFIPLVPRPPRARWQANMQAQMAASPMHIIRLQLDARARNGHQDPLAPYAPMPNDFGVFPAAADGVRSSLTRTAHSQCARRVPRPPTPPPHPTPPVRNVAPRFVVRPPLPYPRVPHTSPTCSGSLG